MKKIVLNILIRARLILNSGEPLAARINGIYFLDSVTLGTAVSASKESYASFQCR